MEVERQGYLNNRYRTRAAIKAAFSRAKSDDNLAEEYAHDAAIAGDTSNLHAKILGKEIASPKELTEALEAIAKDNPTGLSNTKVGTVNGLPIAVEIVNEGEGHLRMVAHIGVKARQRVDLENSFFTDETAAPGVRILNFIRSLSKTSES